MTPERWRQITEVFHAALARDEKAGRGAFLDEACEDDVALRADVEAMLDAHRDAGAFLEPFAAFAETQRLQAGAMIGPYRIDGLVGTGGMGEVYRAYDPRLQRGVAIKVLFGDASSHPDALRRLLREARAAAALNHPHVCTIHEVGEADGQAFIAMELVEGESLDRVLPAGGFPIDRAFRYGVQIADGVAHAHDRGVVHGDLKTANALVTSQGHVKVLDFGLARRLGGVALAEVTTEMQLLTTAPGALVGTLAYMAPEQLRGGQADARSDVWSLGVLLYEMTTGVRPFQGQTGFEVSSAILSQEPAPLPVKVPPPLRAIINRCLEKEPEKRYQRGDEVLAALKAIETGTAVPWKAWRHRTGRRRWLASAAAALAALIGVTAALNVGGLRTRLLGISTPAPIRSIAVLPLAVTSGDSEQEYFADGMTEALTADLAKLGALRVISRTSAMTYKGTRKPLPVIANELNVDALVEGSVLRVGERVRIVVQLIQASTDAHLWTETYERDLQDVLRLQSEVARAVAQEIKVAVTPEERARLASKRTVRPEAYEAYLKGMFFLNKFTPEGFEKGLTYLQQAVGRDAADPYAYSGLALGYTLIGHDTPEYLVRAKAAAQKAVELGEPLAQTYAALGMTRLLSDWDFAGAQRDFRRAVELNPSLGEAHRGYSWSLHVVGRWEEAFAEMSRAKEVEPLTPLFAADLGWMYLVAGQYDAAIDEARKSLELDPNFAQGFYVLGDVYRMKGMYQEAIAMHQRALKWQLGATYALAGQYDEARKIAAEIRNKQKPGPQDDWWLAQVHASLNEKDEAFRRLEAAYKSRFSLMPWIRVWPELAPLRGDLRFEDLARRIGVR